MLHPYLTIKSCNLQHMTFFVIKMHIIEPWLATQNQKNSKFVGWCSFVKLHPIEICHDSRFGCDFFLTTGEELEVSCM